jgi:hypothetical protein
MADYVENKVVYGGCDVSINIITPESGLVKCAEVQTITVSEHSDRGVARALGKRGYSGYCDGIRTCAGTMIFTIIDDSPLAKLLYDETSKTKYFKLSQLPPLDFVLVLQSEYIGAKVLMSSILGVIFEDTGVVYSQEDVKTEMTGSYKAFDYYPLMPKDFSGYDYFSEGSFLNVESLNEVLGYLINA